MRDPYQDACVRNDAQKAIARRYMESNPIVEYTLRSYCSEGIVRNNDSRYVADLHTLFPSAPLGYVCYLWGQFLSTDGSSRDALLIPYGPSEVYLNGKLIVESNVRTERDSSAMSFVFPFRKGANNVVLCFENTVAGFGAEFGTWLGKLEYYFLMPKKEQEGFLVSRPISKRLDHISTMTVQTLPWARDREDQCTEDSFSRLFPEAGKGEYAVALALFLCKEDTELLLSKVSIVLVDGKRLAAPYFLVKGKHEVLLVSERKEDSWGFKCKGKGVFSNALLTFPSDLVWSFAGPFSSLDDALARISKRRVFETSQGFSFWKLDRKNTWVRMYNDNNLFGHWNYPLGVTLYGLAMTERAYRKRCPEFSQCIHTYLNAHLNASISTYQYAIWDKQTFKGSTAVHHLMTSLDSLDDCGSFCSTLLELAKDHELEEYAKIVSAVAEHILRKQPRLEDGTFYRKQQMHAFHNMTMWADDLYMSVPFMVRYSQYAQDPSVLDDAARQFLGFKKRLYLPEKQLFSHVYDFKRNLATGIPWGRGNGWVLFSLSELLQVLPFNHPLRKELVELFASMCSGCGRLQDKEGLWHQVLDMPSSYQETSCTAMFVASFCRGIKNGWLKDTELFTNLAKRGAEGLRKSCIDTEGHVHGVCRGSEFSCSPNYYAKKLLPRLDDTHGIGIVLIALDEMDTLEGRQP
ncbi:MAG: glycoside hydrolase family 88 protein [Sphaerochaetaceae bacterium]